MWANVAEWQWDPEHGQFVGAGPDLPARTSRHGSPAGRRSGSRSAGAATTGMTGTPTASTSWAARRGRAFSEYEPHTMDWHLPRFLAANAEAK